MWLLELDKNIFLKINANHTQFLDLVMYYISYPYTWLPFYIFILWILIKKYKKKSFVLIFALLLSVALSDFTSVHLFKETFRRLRPCHNPLLKDYVHLVKDHCGGRYGFISSHASNSFAIALFTGLAYGKRKFLYLLIFWAFLVAYSRVYLGVHYPSDVLCGACWGAFLGFLIFIAVKKLYLCEKENQSKC